MKVVLKSNTLRQALKIYSYRNIYSMYGHIGRFRLLFCSPFLFTVAFALSSLLLLLLLIVKWYFCLMGQVFYKQNRCNGSAFYTIYTYIYIHPSLTFCVQTKYTQYRSPFRSHRCRWIFNVILKQNIAMQQLILSLSRALAHWLWERCFEQDCQYFFFFSFLHGMGFCFRLIVNRYMWDFFTQ